jgi:hypothetical protein
VDYRRPDGRIVTVRKPVAPVRQERASAQTNIDYNEGWVR